MSEAATAKSNPEATTDTSISGAAQTTTVTENNSDADAAAATSAKAEANKKCPFFGVRSYLHNFYEQKDGKDHAAYETDEYAFLLKPSPRKYGYCRPIAWKAAVWIGINFIIFGIIGIFVAYLVPAKTPVISETSYSVELDRDVKTYNDNLEIVKLVGLLLFCVGGTLTIGGLLVPTILYRYCFDDDLWSNKEHSFKSCKDASPKAAKNAATTVVTTSPDNPATLLQPADPSMQAEVAGASLLSGAAMTQPTKVQPERVKPESVVTQQGLQGITASK